MNRRLLIGRKDFSNQEGKVKMKDFQLRNDTKLMFRNDPVQELCKIVKNKKSTVCIWQWFYKKEWLL